MELEEGRKYSLDELKGFFGRMSNDVKVNGLRMAAFSRKDEELNECDDARPSDYPVMVPIDGNEMLYQGIDISQGDYYRYRIKEPPP
tara:strand:+ start:765 stop:1025 length:261 start_codon:yes stop_codon:yes gene_type:complete